MLIAGRRRPDACRRRRRSRCAVALSLVTTAGLTTAGLTTAGLTTARLTTAGLGAGQVRPASGAATLRARPAELMAAETAAPLVAGETARAAQAVRVALKQIGKPYVYGGSGPRSFDCSGLVLYAWLRTGVWLPHYSVSQFYDTRRVTRAALVPGDLVFYDNYSGPQPGHVALYLGGGRVVSANRPGTRVQVQTIGYDGRVIGYGRVHVR